MISVRLFLPVFFLISGVCFAQNTSSGVAGSGLKPCPKSPNCVSSEAGDQEHAVLPLVYPGSREEARDRLRRVLSAMPRLTVIADEGDHIRAEARSLIFRFVDDVEFYFPAGEKVIHVRSASRIGHSDLGVNRKRVEEIRRRFAELK